MGNLQYVDRVMLVIIVALIQLWCHASEAASWGHSDPDTWSDDYPECGGKQQSPINIDTKKAVYNQMLTPFEFSGFLSADIRGKLKNNGHTAQVDIEGSPFVEAGGLAGTYRTAQFHFHWGNHEHQGSEHTIDEIRYPLEMHMVNYAVKYGDISTAVKMEDGLAVLGCMFKISPYDNPYFEDVVKNLAKVTTPGSVDINMSFPLLSLLPRDITQYYRYSGSLTTPGCYESVQWTIFQDTVPISRTQLEKFRKLIASVHGANDTSENVLDNFRPVQPLNSRIVYTTQPEFLIAAASSLDQRMIWSLVALLISSLSALHLF